MSGKSLIPIVAAGVALYFIADSSKKKSVKKKPADKPTFDGGIIVDSGTAAKWSWRVVEKGGNQLPGFGGAGSRLYYSYVARPEAPNDWLKSVQSGLDTAKAAKALALEFIAQNIPEEETEEKEEGEAGGETEA